MAVVIEKMRAALEQPVDVRRAGAAGRGSIGIAMFPEHGEDVDTLLRHADVAMYSAKEEKSGYVFYDASATSPTRPRLTLVGELRRAIEQHELVLYYQPKAALADGAVTSVEALVRWNHPARGLVAPDEFIPLAEQTGLIKPLTLYVLDEALRPVPRLAARRAATRRRREPVASATCSTRDLPEQVQRLLAAAAGRPGAARARDHRVDVLSRPGPDQARARQARRRWASRSSIDDFGTGYSSLAYLSQLPVNEIKIDRSFVMNMADADNDAVIVRSTIDLARNLGLQVVAEGVETEQAWDELEQLGCTAGPGLLPEPAGARRRAHRVAAAPPSR